MAKLLVVADNQSICKLIHDIFSDLKGCTRFISPKCLRIHLICSESRLLNSCFSI